jgi:hypothetical protein
VCELLHAHADADAHTHTHAHNHAHTHAQLILSLSIGFLYNQQPKMRQKHSDESAVYSNKGMKLTA